MTDFEANKTYTKYLTLVHTTNELSGNTTSTCPTMRTVAAIKFPLPYGSMVHGYKIESAKFVGSLGVGRDANSFVRFYTPSGGVVTPTYTTDGFHYFVVDVDPSWIIDGTYSVEIRLCSTTGSTVSATLFRSLLCLTLTELV